MNNRQCLTGVVFLIHRVFSVEICDDELKVDGSCHSHKHHQKTCPVLSMVKDDTEGKTLSTLLQGRQNRHHGNGTKGLPVHAERAAP